MKNNGFTLLETMIYLALFAMLMMGALMTVYTLMGSAADNQSFEGAYTEGIFIQQKLAWELSAAQSVVLVGTSTLQIIQSSRTLELCASSSRLWLREINATAEPLSSDEFGMSNIVMAVVPGDALLPAHVSIRYTIRNIPFQYQTYLHD